MRRTNKLISLFRRCLYRTENKLLKFLYVLTLFIDKREMADKLRINIYDKVEMFYFDAFHPLRRHRVTFVMQVANLLLSGALFQIFGFLPIFQNIQFTYYIF